MSKLARIVITLAIMTASSVIIVVTTSNASPSVPMSDSIGNRMAPSSPAIPPENQWSRLPRVRTNMAQSVKLTPLTYTVKSGDTLSKIAAKLYGTSNDWPALWYTNRTEISNPDAIKVGLILKLGPRSATPAMAKAALAAIPAPVPSLTATPTRQVSAPSIAPVSASGFGIWGCIAHFESGGDWSINTGNGFYGGLQFAESTWLGYGGGAYAQYANEASPSEQITIAIRVQAGQGWGAWPVTSRECGV